MKATTESFAWLTRAAVLLVVTGTTAAQSTQEGPESTPAFDGLVDRLDSLERDNNYLRAEVDQLRAEAGQKWLTEERSEDIRLIVEDVLADSSSRSSLQDSGALAGWDASRGFYLRSADNRFLLQLSGLVQARYLWSHSSGGGLTNAFNSGSPQRLPNNAYGFDLPHTRLVFKGHVFEPGIRYFVRTEFTPFSSLKVDSLQTNSPSTGALDLLDAYVAFDLDNQWTIRIGQFKLPYSRERLVSVQNLLTADRSSVDELMSVGRSQGIELSTRSDSLYWALAFSDGGTDNLLAGISNNSGYFPVGTAPINSPYWDQQASYAFTSRAEYKLSGDWSEFKEMTSPMGGARGLLLGMAAHYQSGPAPSNQSSPGAPALYNATSNNEWIAVTADLSWNLGGASVYGAIYYSNSETNWSLQNQNTGRPRVRGTTNLIGLLVQGSMYITPKWEVFGRYQYIDPSTTPTINSQGLLPVEFSPLSILTLGANWYIDGQDLRWSFQLGYSFNEVTTVSATNGNGFRPMDRATNELVILTQIQLQF